MTNATGSRWPDGCRCRSGALPYASKPPAQRRSPLRALLSPPTWRARVADDCLFCRILRDEIPAKVVAKTDDCLAFRDINPQAPSHIVIIPREHVPSLNQLRDPDVVG